MDARSASLTLCEGKPPSPVVSSKGVSNAELWCCLCCYTEQTRHGTVHWEVPGPRLNIRKDVFSSDLVKSRSHEIGTLNCRIALKFDRHIGSTAAEVPVKFQNDRTNLNTNLAASRLYEILRKELFSDIETGPRSLVEQTVECCSIFHFKDTSHEYRCKIFQNHWMGCWHLSLSITIIKKTRQADIYKWLLQG